MRYNRQRLRRGRAIAPKAVRRRANPQPVSGTLLDLRGCIRVNGPQDWAAIRRQVTLGRAR